MLKYMKDHGVVNTIRSPPKYPRLIEPEEIKLMIGRAVIQTEARREQLLKVKTSEDNVSMSNIEVEVGVKEASTPKNKSKSRSPKRGGRGKSGSH